MKTSVIIYSAALLGGCVAPPARQNLEDHYVEHSVKMVFCELAIGERSTVDSATKPYNGVIDGRAHAEAFLPVLHADWNRIVSRVRNGTLTGTETWSVQKREEVIAYALRQRTLLGLGNINEN